MNKIKEKFKSVRFRLFLIMCITIMIIVICLIAINSLVLETFYIYSKTNTVKQVYAKINNYYNKEENSYNIDSELKRIAFNNNFDILIKTESDIIVFSTDKDFHSTIRRVNDLIEKGKMNKDKNMLFSNNNMVIRKIDDKGNDISYILLDGNLENGYKLYIRIPVLPIKESVKISNNVLIGIGGITIILSALVSSFISKKFTEPILQLNDIADQMARLDFSKKYRITDTDDEINDLGKSINTMSDKLEKVIKQLRENNLELEKDIEQKSKIDEMRKQFISDVSHELKTPIALIQGYAEGLIENVNTDEESRKFYAEVILDESNKMDKLVKQLLELMKLEYGKRQFHNEKLDVVALIKEIIRKYSVMLQENKINVKFELKEPVYVYADEMYLDQIITNYFSNAIKHVDEINGKKEIKITVTKKEESNKIKISVFNTGANIEEENLERIWGRFYKIDTSRNREQGGTGIGLALVKAIMNNYKNDYGVINKKEGVEFYFEIEEYKEPA